MNFRVFCKKSPKYLVNYNFVFLTYIYKKYAFVKFFLVKFCEILSLIFFNVIIVFFQSVLNKNTFYSVSFVSFGITSIISVVNIFSFSKALFGLTTHVIIKNYFKIWFYQPKNFSNLKKKLVTGWKTRLFFRPYWAGWKTHTLF